MGNLLEMILKAGDGKLVKEMGQQHGLNPMDAFNAIKNLLPSLTNGMKSNMQQDNGVGSILDALQKGNHQKYIDNPREILNQSAIDDGNSILGHILGSKDRSREVAAQAAQATGIDVSILKKILPQLAGVTMGGMSKRVNTRESGGLLDALTKANQQSGQASNPLNDILGKVLGGQTQQAPQKSGGLGGLLGSLFGKKRTAQPQAQQMPDIGGILGSLLGGGSAKQLPPQVQSQMGSVLGKMLDMDGDGNTMDDIFNMAKKFL